MAHDDDSINMNAPAPERILNLLGLQQSFNVSELRAMVANRFRHPQQVQLASILQTMQSTSALANVTAWFSHQFDPTDDVEHYLQDLIRMHHYVSAHDRQRPLRSNHMTSLQSPTRSTKMTNFPADSSSSVTNQLMNFYSSFADTRDRHLLTKIYQTLGLSRAITYCVVAKTLPLKCRNDLLDLFAEDLPELRVWINWLDDLDHATIDTTREEDQDGENFVGIGPGYESAVSFVVRTIREHCTLTWLELLRPLSSTQRLAIIDSVHAFLAVSNNSAFLSTTTSTLKKLGRFYETTGIPAQKLLDLDPAVRSELSLLLEEFPTIILITLFAKFNSEKMIHLVVKRGLPFFPKNDLLKMLEALAPADTNAIEVFVATLFNFGRKKIDLLLIFLSFSSQNQLRFLDLMVATSNSPLNTDSAAHLEEEDAEDAFSSTVHLKGNYFLFKLFLHGNFTSPDLVIHKLSTLPNEIIEQLMHSVTVHSAEDFVVLGRGLEIVELSCLIPFLRLFFAVQIDWREALVRLVEDMPGEEALLLYDTLISLCGESGGDTKVTSILQMFGGLEKKDKKLLCRDILINHSGTKDEDESSSSPSTGTHAKILLYLCECELSRHKVIRLLRVIPFAEYDRLIFLLRTQRMPEQVALTRLMLSMPPDANCRLLSKMSLWSTETVDAFFQLLLMLPKVEYKVFAKLMGSQYVSPDQMGNFVTVAVDMMNQASSRELVIFAAELPIPTRNLFFEMLTDKPEKGVLLRIIGYATRVEPELMHALVSQFHRMSWDIRSSFVEQLRALDNASDVQKLAEVAASLKENDSLRQLVLLFNPVSIHIRMTLVTIFLQLSIHERVLVLTRLVEMPKSAVASFCAAICQPNCAPVSPSFCRVVGLVDAKYHASLLRLLTSESLWFFLHLMAEYCNVDADGKAQIVLLNQVAKLVGLFTLNEHFIVLREVIREALADSLSLHDVVTVLAFFPKAPRLLEFLRYVNVFAKCSRSSLLFRVLSKYRQAAFIFEMCRILDLDDAVFALKRLDRMWQRRHEELDKALSFLARRFAKGNIHAKDDFCDLIVGFKGMSSTVDDEATSSLEHVLTPRAIDTAAAVKGTQPDTDDENDSDELLQLPSATPPSHVPVPLNRHLQRTRPDQAFPRKRTDRKAWWQDLDDSAYLLIPHSVSEADDDEPTSPQLEQPERNPTVESSTSLPSVFALTEQLLTPRQHEDTKPPTARLPAISSCDNLHKPIDTPAVHTCESQQLGSDQPATEWRHLKTDAGTDDKRPLSRSESAPATLTFENESQWNRQKRGRGIAAALDSPLEFHVGRDKGADFLKKQRERAHHEKFASRIRHAKTPGAQDHVMEARVALALGKRSQVAQLVQPPLSPLVRPDKHTVENAVVTLARAAQLREATCLGFVAEFPLRDPPPAKHHARILPINAAKPASPEAPTLKPDTELNSEPVAPW